MRTLEGHKVNGANERLEIAVTDQPGHGGANHRYQITGLDFTNNKSAKGDDFDGQNDRCVLLFQNGPIAEVGVNGITHEALLEILIDRLNGFQAGRYANQYNAAALEYLRDAQRALQRRTAERLERGVEGTHTV